MDLKAWRQAQPLTLDATARKLGIPGKNPGRTLQRIETGEQMADADLVADIGRLTKGAVHAADLHATRLAFLERSGRRRDAGAPTAVPAE